MAVSVRFHREDPWELIRLMRAAMPDTLAQLHHDRHALHRLAAVRRGRDAARVPLRRPQRHPPLPVRRAGERPAGARAASRAWRARRASRRSSSGSRTRSARCTRTRTTPSASRRSPDCADIDRFYLKDPGGLLTTDAVRELAPHFVATRAHRSSCTATARSGSRRSSTWRAWRPASRCCTRPIGPAGSGTSQPTVESTLRNLEAEGYAHRLDPKALAAAARTSASSCARSACRRACRASTTPPTTTTSCRAGW